MEEMVRQYRPILLTTPRPDQFGLVLEKMPTSFFIAGRWGFACSQFMRFCSEAILEI